MDIKNELLLENSKAQWLKVYSYILDHPEKFEELIGFLLSNNYRLAQRASPVVGHLAEHNVAFIVPYLGKLINNLNGHIHDAVKRNTIRMFQFVDFPEELLGEVADKCFKYLDSEREPVAVRVCSMTVLCNIVCKVPGLKDELTMMIEDHLPYGSAAYKAKAKEVLAKLRKLKAD